MHTIQNSTENLRADQHDDSQTEHDQAAEQLEPAAAALGKLGARQRGDSQYDHQCVVGDIAGNYSDLIL